MGSRRAKPGGSPTRELWPFALLLTLAGCGGGASDQGRGGQQAGGAQAGGGGNGGQQPGGDGGGPGGAGGGQQPGGAGGGPAGNGGGGQPAGTGGTQVVSCADAGPPADADDTAGGDGGDASAPGDLRECGECRSSAACASGLECGRPASGSCALAFCVDPYETTECCAGTGSGAACVVVDGSMSAAKQCPAQKPATASVCQRQGRCLYGPPPFQTPCECLAGIWQCHDCPTSRPTGACPGGAAGQLCAYGGAQCSCQTASPQSPGTWHCNSCPATPPSGSCAANDYCGYATSTSCVCASAATWGCFGPG